MMDSSVDISKLSTLLTESKLAQENNEKFSQPPQQTETTLVRAAGTTEITSSKKVNNPKSIWSDDEIVSEDSFIDSTDKRPSPRYEFTYKQTVGTEDTFLGLNDKTPLSSDCTHLVIKVHFPGCSLKDIDLKLSSQRIVAQSSQLKLMTYLPVKVDDSNGNAKFDSKKEVLIVTAPIVHEI